MTEEHRQVKRVINQLFEIEGVSCAYWFVDGNVPRIEHFGVMVMGLDQQTITADVPISSDYTTHDGLATIAGIIVTRELTSAIDAIYSTLKRIRW